MYLRDKVIISILVFIVGVFLLYGTLTFSAPVYVLIVAIATLILAVAIPMVRLKKTGSLVKGRFLGTKKLMGEPWVVLDYQGRTVRDILMMPERGFNKLGYGNLRRNDVVRIQMLDKGLMVVPKIPSGNTLRGGII